MAKKFDVMEYLKKNPLTEEQLLTLAVEMVDPRMDMFSLEEERIIMDDLSKVERLPEYLTSLMNWDVRRHFKAASPVEQINARGAFSRTLFLKAKIVKHLKTKKEKSIPKLTKRSNAAV